VGFKPSFPLKRDLPHWEEKILVLKFVSTVVAGNSSPLGGKLKRGSFSRIKYFVGKSKGVYLNKIPFSLFLI
jgi:hypothetical protein